MRIEIFYHICAKGGAAVLEIIEEQLLTIKNSELYDKIDKVNCCLVGDDEHNYQYLLDKIPSYGDKFIIAKSQFKDMTYEFFTVDYMSKNISEDGLYLYLHSKGVTKTASHPVRDWRRCMEYFLITKADKCIEKLKEGYDTVGIMKTFFKYPHYSGNFWWATGKYLIKIFSETPIPKQYGGIELYIVKNNSKSYDMYPIHDIYPKYDGYHVLLPLEKYENYSSLY